MICRCLLLVVLCASADAQIIGTVGLTTRGLGSPAGYSFGMDLRFKLSRIEFASRTLYNAADKVGSDDGGSVTEQVIVRYGDRILIGGGVFGGRVTGIFGSRTVVGPLVQIAYRYNPANGHEVLPYATFRPIEWGNNFTRDHATRAAEFGVELMQSKGRVLFFESVGAAVLWFRNVGDPLPRHGTKGFVRFGVGWQF